MNFPKSVIRFLFLAILPSKVSVMPAIIKMTEKEWSDKSGVSEVKRRKTFLE